MDVDVNVSCLLYWKADHWNGFQEVQDVNFVHLYLMQLLYLLKRALMSWTSMPTQRFAFMYSVVTDYMYVSKYISTWVPTFGLQTAK